MEHFKKDIYMKGCHLITRMYGDTSNMYQFVFNPETAEFSDISLCGTGLDFEIEEDGVYRVVTLKIDNAELIENGIKIGVIEYTTEELMEALENGTYYDPRYFGEYDIDSMLSICKLKKCLATLELNVFQDLLKNCGKINCKTSEVKSERDFLYIAVWLIEHYLELGNIERAQAIYDNLKGCGNLCQNLTNDKRSCGCNG